MSLPATSEDTITDTTVDAQAEPRPASDWSWLSDADDLGQLAADAGAQQLLALDTEFVRRSTYHAGLGLVQLACRQQVRLLDPIALPLREPLGALLADATIGKLIHAGGEDIEVLARWTGVRPVNLIDTQIAAQLCGEAGQIAYHKLVAARLGVSLSKGEQQSDWLRRPLSDSQCRYAADDVRYLEPLAASLLADIDRLDRRAWLQEDCERQIERVLAPPPRHPHLTERNAGQYPPEVQYRLGWLLRWRDEEARRRDKPRSWILPNATVTGLAFAGAEDRAGVVRALREGGRRDPERDAARFIDLLAQAGQAPSDFPLAPAPLEAAAKSRLAELRQQVADLAARLELAPEFLATRSVLEARVREGRWPDGIGQWRTRLLESLG